MAVSFFASDAMQCTSRSILVLLILCQLVRFLFKTPPPARTTLLIPRTASLGPSGPIVSLQHTPTFASFSAGAHQQLNPSRTQRYELNDVEGHWDFSTGSPEFHRNRTGKAPHWEFAPAKRCLAHRHIVFLGDSILRHQYLALIYFLEYGHWSGDRMPNVCAHKGWGGESKASKKYRVLKWTRFFDAMSRVFHGHETCHFSRNDLNKSNDYELRTYEWRTHGLKLSYVGWFGNITLRGPLKWWDGTLSDNNHTTGFNYCNANPSLCWWLNATETLRQIIPQMAPTDIVVNTGVWHFTEWSFPLTPEFFVALASAGKDAVRKSQTQSNRGTEARVFWKTTTAVCQQQQPAKIDETPASILRRSGWGIFDAGRITSGLSSHEEVFLDCFHYTCAIYNQLNMYLLDLLCS